MKTLAAGLLTLLLLGCSKPGDNSPQSSAADAVNTMTQRNKLEAGRKAGQQLKAIAAERDEDVRQALE